jgi:hypothetical protein
MKKTYGVCVGMLAMGLAVLGAPVSRAAGEPGSAAETSASIPASSTSSTAAPSAADLRAHIEALKAELAGLNTALADVSSDDQDQGGAPPATPAAAAPMPLPSPSMTAPLSTAIPHEFSAGPFGKLEVTGILSGMGWTEGDYTPGPPVNDTPTHYDISNAQVFIQKTSGWWQFYLQGGAYNLPAIGTPFVRTIDTMNYYGPFATGYLKLVKGNFNVEVGELPTLIGAEYTFSFENMNIERGLLWNQENAVVRGIQLNEAYKKLTLAFSYNDGFFSNRYTSLSGSVAYAFNAANTLSFVGMGNAGTAYIRKFPNAFSPTPFYQNNSQIYNVIYTYSKGNWMVTPYYQYTYVPSNSITGQGAHTNSGAVLANYNFKHGISLAGRVEYIKSSGSLTNGDANLLGYGTGSSAYSVTITPTYSKDGFFVRGDFSLVSVTNFTPATTLTNGGAFGAIGMTPNQPRGVIEAGFLF